MAVLTNEIVADLVRRTRSAQGLPRRVRDAGTIRKVAAMILTKTESAREGTSRGSQSAARSGRPRRATGEAVSVAS